MAERSAEVDQMKGATLEQISSMVEEIGKEFKSKQSQLNPLMAEVKVTILFSLYDISSIVFRVRSAQWCKPRQPLSS
jgi:hypothetical protein